MRQIFIMAAMIFVVSCSKKGPGTSDKLIQYQVDGKTFHGHFAQSKLPGKRPAVIVVHEWWGHNTYAKKRADMLADLGYHAFALDMYGDGKQASHPKDAGAFAKEALKDPDVARKRFMGAMNFLRTQKNVDAEKIAAIGYCFGGSVVLTMAKMGVDLKGVVSFHGSLSSPIKAQEDIIKAKVLVLNGESDPFIKPADILNFKNEMTAAKVSFQFVNYPNALHAFTNPEATELGKKFNIPLAYDKGADEDSWNRMKNFLEEVF